MKPIIILISSILVGVLLAFGYIQFFPVKKTVSSLPTPTLPIPSVYPFSIANPPSETLTGTVTAQKGIVKVTSRTDTIPKLFSSSSIVQGEEVITEKNSSLSATFSPVGSFELGAETHINVVQTLPTNMVITQQTGDVTYTASTDTPIGVRALHLLVQEHQGKMNVMLDTEKGRITIHVLEGSVELAFNNKQAETQYSSFTKGKTIVYDETTRTIDTH
ncbi:DUF3379 domain-containing protein [Candidatus Roizmanbacteria bacterium]|nr:DUF3379 domain-containing protein [Candidatus Roizmanbacteria bacterium]